VGDEVQAELARTGAQREVPEGRPRLVLTLNRDAEQFQVELEPLVRVPDAPGGGR